MPSIRARLALLVLLAWMPPVISRAGDQIFRHNYTEYPDTFVEVQSVFGAVAKQGSLPYRITIRNHSGKDRVWTVKMGEGNFGRSLTTRASFRIEVEEGAEVQREVILAFAPAFLAYDYRNLEITVSATGLAEEKRDHGEQTPQDFPLLGISKSLAQRSLTRLDDVVKNQNSSNPSFAKVFEPEQLPVDWLGYTGLDAVLLDEPAWRGLAAAQRQALVAWVRLGGRLDLYGETAIDPTTLGLPFTETKARDGSRSLSLGIVKLSLWDGKELPDSVVNFYRTLPQASQALERDFNNDWKLQSDFGTKEFNPILVFILLLIFAILVAPVNLFYLAKPGRRHRLFITTPIISVVTCLLIILVILFIDGVGGKGTRVILADLQPGQGETRVYLSQEQISRTGVMLSSSFEADQPYDLNPVNLPESQFNPFSHSGQRPSTYEISDGRFDGEFFRSRSEQGFAIRAVEPGRARIEYSGEENGIPVLISNLSQEIVALQYRDAKGTLWKSPDVTSVSPGGMIPLEKMEKEVWPDWIRETTERFSEARQGRVKNLQSDRHRFFAQVRDPEAFALPTHPGLRWEKTRLLLTGTPAGGPVAETTPQEPAAQ